MHTTHAKAVRRRLLEFLYERYRRDPTEMIEPPAFFEAGFAKDDLVFGMHYLHDHGLVEMLMGYQPPLFAAARLHARGIDAVENRFEFDRRFPAEPGTLEGAFAELPRLLERLAEEAELSPLDGEARQALLRDVAYLRAEIARPADRWRRETLDRTAAWIAAPFGDPAEHLPSLATIQALIRLLA